MARLNGNQRRAQQAEQRAARQPKPPAVTTPYGPGGSATGSGQGQAQQNLESAAAKAAVAAKAEAPAKAADTAPTSSVASTPVTPSVSRSDPAKAELSKKPIIKYPKDLLDNNTDYLRIKFVEYQPAFSAGSTSTPSSGGSTKSNSKGDAITTFYTYMPNNLGTGYAQNWGSTTFSPNGRIGVTALQKGISGGDVGGYLQKALRGTETTFAADRFAAGISGLAKGTSGLDANSLLGLTQGIGINSTVEIYWSGHGQQRQFSFRIEMGARDEKESEDIREIVRAFKLGMHPGSGGGSAANAVQSRFVTYPYMFEISYMSGQNEHEFLNKFKPCVLENMSVEYTPNGTYSTLPNTSPVVTIMTLNFKELKHIYREDILESTGAGY